MFSIFKKKKDINKTLDLIAISIIDIEAAYDSVLNDNIDNYDPMNVTKQFALKSLLNNSQKEAVSLK